MDHHPSSSTSVHYTLHKSISNVTDTSLPSISDAPATPTPSFHPTSNVNPVSVSKNLDAEQDIQNSDDLSFNSSLDLTPKATKTDSTTTTTATLSVLPQQKIREMQEEKESIPTERIHHSSSLTDPSLISTPLETEPVVEMTMTSYTEFSSITDQPKENNENKFNLTDMASSVSTNANKSQDAFSDLKPISSYSRISKSPIPSSPDKLSSPKKLSSRYVLFSYLFSFLFRFPFNLF